MFYNRLKTLSECRKRTFIPLISLRKVYAIPPPMIISLTLSSRFSISWILSATLAPPRMARNGLRERHTNYIEQE